VTDRASVLGAARASALDERLAAFERETSNQVLVYVDRRLPESATIEELASRAYREWGIGQKGTSNGVLFLVFTEDRKMRIEVGRGLEGAIPDVLAGRILRERVRPLLASGDVAGGVEAGVEQILSLARGEPYRGQGRTLAEQRNRGVRDSTVLIFAGSALALVLLVTIIGIVRTVRRSGWKGFLGAGSGSGSSSGGSWSSSDSSSSSSSDSSSSSSDSSYSGGGGDSGGGGASDSF
jgi:uncharacterized protein